MLQELRGLEARTWLRAVPLSLLAMVVIAVPADLIENRFFGRPIPPGPVDYVILVVTAALIGLILAIRPDRAAGVASETETDFERQSAQTMWGGFVSFLAVGCPVCNQAVVALLGTSGALSWWAPVQPVVGLAAVALLLFTLHKRLATFNLSSCPIPAT